MKQVSTQSERTKFPNVLWIVIAFFSFLITVTFLQGIQQEAHRKAVLPHKNPPTHQVVLKRVILEPDGYYGSGAYRVFWLDNDSNELQESVLNKKAVKVYLNVSEEQSSWLDVEPGPDIEQISLYLSDSLQVEISK